MFDVNTFINGWLYFLTSEKEKKESLDKVNKLKKLNNNNFDTQSIISFSELLEKTINFLKEKGFWKENYKNILEEEFKSFEKTSEGISFFIKRKYPQTLICDLLGRISIDQTEKKAISFIEKLGFENVKLEKNVTSPVNDRPVVSLLKFEFTPLQ
jgi:hypothetical protein